MSYPTVATDIVIEYNTINSIIQQNTITKIYGIDNLPYLKIPYDNQNVSFKPLIKGLLTDDAYTSSNLYLYGELHTNLIKDEVVGEIVIEHFGDNNDNNKLYTCFLLTTNTDGQNTQITNILTGANAAIEAKTNVEKAIKLVTMSQKSLTDLDSKATAEQKTAANKLLTDYTTAMDKIITESYNANVNFNLNALSSAVLNDNPIKMYLDIQSNLVIVFKTPIQVSTANATDLTKMSKTTNLFLVTSGPEEISIDCSPTGESDEQIKMYNIPIASDFAKEKNITDFMKTTTNFFVFLLGAVLTYFLVPHVYKKIVIDTILTTNALENVTGGNKEEKLIQRLIGADTLITVIFMMTGFSFIFSKNPTLMLIGSLLIVLYVIAYALIQSKRTDTEYMRVILGQAEGPATERGEKSLAFNEFNLNILKKFEVMQNLKFLFMNIFYLYFNFWGTVIKSLGGQPSIQTAAIYIVVFTGLLFMHWFLFFGDNNTPDKSSFDGKNNSKPHPDIIQNNHSLIVAYFLFVAPILTSGLDLYWS